MPPKQRQMRVESKSALAAMQKLESRSDEELEAETRYRAAAPAPGAPIWRRAAGILLVLALIVAALAIGWGIVQLVSLPFGGLDPTISIFWGFCLVAITLGVLAFVGRRRQNRAREKAAQQRAE